MSACLDCGGSECICSLKAKVVALERERDEAREQLAHDRDHGLLSAAQREIDGLNKECNNLISERDQMEELLTTAARHVGCVEDWSNSHWHGKCIAEAFDTLMSESDTLSASLASARERIAELEREGK